MSDEPQNERAPMTTLCDLNCDLDAEDLTLLSLGAGVAAFIFSSTCGTHWIFHLTLPCGVVAIACGYKALKHKTPWVGAALWGFSFGVYGVAVWLTSFAYRHIVALFGG